MGYTLNITAEDFRTFEFVGDRYDWSAACLRLLDVGENEISEPDAWSLAEAFESDTEGGHSPFPMLDHRSDLADRLISFWESIV